MQVFQAAALGNDNMQDVVRQILQTTEDSAWEEEGFVEAVCHELAKQCVESSRVSFLDALYRVKEKKKLSSQSIVCKNKQKIPLPLRSLLPPPLPPPLPLLLP